jgi:hypothetical protein
MVALALPIMVGLSANEILTAAVIMAGAAAGLAKSLDEFRRPGAEALATGLETAASLAEMVADAVAGAKLPVGVGPPPNWDPLGGAIAAIKGAADSIWDALNGNRGSSGATDSGTSWSINNTTSGSVIATFSTYLRQYIDGVTIPAGFVHRYGDDSTALPPGYTSWFSQNTTVTLPPGQSNLSIEYIPTGNTNYNEREWYWKVSVGEEVYTQSIYGYAPGMWLGWATVHLPQSTTATSGGQTVSKPNNLTPQAFKETEKRKPMAPPLPYLPAFAPDIGTPVTPGKDPSRPGTTPATPTDPTKKEDPKAPPNLQPAKVPIWRPGVLPATTPNPATVPAPARNPQTIPNTNPARPNVAFDVAAKPLPQAATAVKPTATTEHKVGPITIPAKAPAATLLGIAEEVGRIEQKLEIVLNPGNKSPDVSWMGDLAKLVELLLSATAGGKYQMLAPCEFNPDGSRVKKEAPYGGSLDRIGVLHNKVDALAAMMQHGKDLKQPICDEPIPRSTVTVTAYEVMGS